MKNKFFIYFLSLFIIIFGATTFAASVTEKGNILDSFKERQNKILFESDYGGIDAEDAEILDIGKRIDIFNTIQQSVSEKRKGLEVQYEGLVNEIYSLEKSIDALDKDIENKRQSINRINSKVISVKEEVESSKKTIELLGNKIATSREVLLDYLVYIYKKTDSISSGDDIDNLKSVLLNEENISDLIDDVYYKGLIEVAGKELVDKHRSYVSELYLKKVNLEKQEKTLKVLRKDGIIEKKILNDKKKFKEDILSESKGKQDVYKKFIDNKVNIERKLKLTAFKENIKFNSAKDRLLQKYGCGFIDVDKEGVDLTGFSNECIKLNKIISSEGKLKDLEKDGFNLFLWPIIPRGGFSSYFQDQGYKKTFGSSHDAIDIPAAQGSSIRAPADGYVMYIEEPTTPDYAYLALKHADGFVTVYGHVSEILVGELDFVKKGQIIAKVGGEFGTNGAGFLSTGPHLHFEVYFDKSPVDPLNFLDLSYVPFALLTDKYKYKFYTDFKTRKGYEFKRKEEEETKGNVFRIEGSSETERQKFLINTYATSTFNNWEIWVEESLDANLDPTFVMCIGLAETGLGRFLKTPYNVGNVGNTDSGATTTFYNSRQGIYAMASTLNNRYLSQYNKIKDLSRYGNRDPKKPIYASSPDNWHNNIVKCMSHVKGTYVPDDYEFRLINN